jgi:hypothetical protein
VALASSWGVCEALGTTRADAIDLPVREAPLFYGCCAPAVLGA